MRNQEGKGVLTKMENEKENDIFFVCSLIEYIVYQMYNNFYSIKSFNFITSSFSNFTANLITRAKNPLVY